MEAELRAILAAALEDDGDAAVDLANAIRQRFAPFGGVELPDHPPVAPRPLPEFE